MTHFWYILIAKELSFYLLVICFIFAFPFFWFSVSEIIFLCGFCVVIKYTTRHATSCRELFVSVKKERIEYDGGCLFYSSLGQSFSSNRLVEISLMTITLFQSVFTFVSENFQTIFFRHRHWRNFFFFQFLFLLLLILYKTFSSLLWKKFFSLFLFLFFFFFFLQT